MNSSESERGAGGTDGGKKDRSPERFVPAVVVSAVAVLVVAIALKATGVFEEKDDKPKVCYAGDGRGDGRGGEQGGEQGGGGAGGGEAVLGVGAADAASGVDVAGGDSDGDGADADGGVDGGGDDEDIKRACSGVLESVKSSDAGSIYNALTDFVRVIENKGKVYRTNVLVENYEMDVKVFYHVLAFCGFSEGQVLDVFKKAVEQGDTRMARLLAHYFEVQCSSEYYAILADLFELQDKERSECESLYRTCLREVRRASVGKCMTPPLETGCIDREFGQAVPLCDFLDSSLGYDPDADKECDRRVDGEHDERVKVLGRVFEGCPEKRARGAGADLDGAMKMEAEYAANQLFTLRLAFLNSISSDEAVTDDMCMQYIFALGQMVVHCDISSFLEALGVADVDEFVAKYVAEASRLFAQRGFEGRATAVENVWLSRGWIHGHGKCEE